MADNSKKLSELPTASNAASTDRLLILRDPAGTPSTRTITVTNLSAAVSNNIPAANTTIAGTVKVGNNLSVNATGFLEATYFNPSIYSIVTISNTSTYTANSSVDVILCDPATAGANVNVILPLNATQGKTYTVKNINANNHYAVVYATTPGRIETPNWGTFGNGYSIGQLGDAECWIFDNGYYRHIGSKRTPATGPYADDATAAAAGVKVYQSYYDASGYLKIRLT